MPHPTLTESQIDTLDDIFDDDKASALRKMLKPGLFRKAMLPIDAIDKKRKGLLSIAAFNNAIKCMKVLLDAGADINQRDKDGDTPLHWAAGMFHTEAVRLLLAAGADSTARNKNGSTPLNWVRTREASECRTLLKADMRARGMNVPDGPVMTLDELRQKLNREAVLFHSKAAQGEPAGTQSWLGRVTWQHPGEKRPVDTEGTPLEPLATLFVRDLPYVPAPLRKLELITIYAPQEAWAMDPEEEPRLGCVIRGYASTEGLEPCDYTSDELTPCILTPEHVENDIPKWPDCGGSDELWEEICEHEIIRGRDYQEDIYPADYDTHKLGGYPTYAQGAPDIPAGYEFVLQISFDENAGLTIGDLGNYFFFYNASENDWQVYADCY